VDATTVRDDRIDGRAGIGHWVLARRWNGFVDVGATASDVAFAREPHPRCHGAVLGRADAMADGRRRGVDVGV
jgi:hypothetical protein